MPRQNKKIYLCVSEKQKDEYAEFIKEISTEYELLNIEDIHNEKDPRVLLLGGDGSLNYFVNNALKDSNMEHCEVIYFPTGTANDFARSFKIQSVVPSLDKLESIIRTGNKVKIPLMSCNDKYFINVASAGSPAKVTNSGEDLLKNLTGKLSYYIAAFEEVLNPEKYKITCSIGDEVNEYEVHGFLISQGLYAGGGVKVSTSYTPNMGDVFNFISFDGEDSTDLIKTIIELQREEPTFESENFIDKFARQMKITSNKPIPIKLDGEDYEADKFTFKKESVTFDLLLH